MIRSPSSRRAFTLIEILVVLAVVLVLSALLLSVFSRVRNNARMSSCASNLHQIYLACSMYSSDNAGLLPAYPSRLSYTGAPGNVMVEQSQELVSSLNHYLHSQQVWRCPSDGTTSSPETVETANGSVVLAHATSYDYRGWQYSEKGTGVVNIDGPIVDLDASKLPLIQDRGCCPTDDGQYQAYNHGGWWNRVYKDGHSKPFSFDCSDKFKPTEQP